jgi:hypothetical protein
VLQIIWFMGMIRIRHSAELEFFFKMMSILLQLDIVESSMFGIEFEHSEEYLK